MNDLVYPRERSLGAVTLVGGLLLWALLIVGTLGIALFYMLLGFIAYLFAQSALIAYIKGNGVEVSATQFPDLHQQYLACCERLEISERPQVYVLNGNGLFNAFATKFLGFQYVVLLSDVIDAMRQHPDGVSFYLGHELGHLKRKHITGQLLRAPVLWLPLLGAAYSRARESTCDRHGRACCSTPEGAARALAALATGSQRWEQLDLPSFAGQIQETSGFWMSLHELTSGYPYLTKRVARLLDPEANMPSRNPLAYLFALFAPYGGRTGGSLNVLVTVAIIGILAAVALPAYQDYTVRAKMAAAMSESQPVRDELARYYLEHKKTPQTLAEAGQPDRLTGGAELQLDSKRMLLSVKVGTSTMEFVPRLDAENHIKWACRPGGGTRPNLLPSSCRVQGE